MGKGENEPTNQSYLENELHMDAESQHQKLPPLSHNKVSPDETNGHVGNDPEVEIPDAAQIEALKRLQERREREPLWYCNLITKYPLQSFILTLMGHVCMVLLSVILLASGYDLLPIDFENLPLEINDQPERPRDLAWTNRDSYINYYDRTPLSGFREKSYWRANIALYYDTEGGNIFTKANLQKIQSIENELTSVSEYVSTYCQLDSTLSACAKPTSIIRFFDATYSSISAVFNDPNFDNIPGVLYEASTNNATAALLQFFLGKSYSITSTSAYSSITRSMLPMGFPLDGYVDDTDGYEKVVQTFSATKMDPILLDALKNTNEFVFSYRSDLLWNEYVFGQAMKDVLCAVGSITFIFILIVIHTKSLWIAGFAILSIMTSFLCTNLIYRIVLDFRYIGFFHILTLFIVLGIGADDIFVFYDVWRNTAYYDYPSLSHRLSDAYRKSVWSMLFTSITTAVAFFASAISPLLATRSFGVFSGLVIIVNYLSVIVYFPTVVVMYHTRFENFKWPCIRFCKRKCGPKCACCRSNSEKETVVENTTYNSNIQRDSIQNTKFDGFAKPSFTRTNSTNQAFVNNEKGANDSSSSVSIIQDKNEKFRTEISINNPDNAKNNQVKMKPQNNDTVVVNDQYMQGVENTGFENDDESSINSSKNLTKSNTDTSKRYGVAKNRKEKTTLVRFFGTKYFSFVTHKVARWVILAVMLAVLIFFTIQATRLEPDNEGLKVLKDSHPFSIAEDHASDSFVASNEDRTINIYILWGFNENDMSDCHFSTPDCEGKPQLDSTFDPNTPAAQLAVKAMCDKMYAFTEEEGNLYYIKKDFTTGEYQINCYIKNLGTYLDAETVSTGTDWSLTYDYTKAVAFMDARTHFYNSATFDSGFTDYLEIPISNWLNNNYTFDYQNDFFMFDSLIGEETGPYSSNLITDTTKKYGNSIKYVAIQVNTTLQISTLGYSKGIPIMERWEKFVSDEMTAMPDGMKNGWQTTQLIWHWLLVQQMLAQNAVYGIVIGVSLAYPILTIATGNFITGALATFSMCCSTVCVLGVIPLGGWKLGVLVSLNMCMVVGLTVDYVVHLAEGYTISLHLDRKSRVRDMLDEMGVSIFFGACTTLGASCFMFFAQLSFFLQFGIFMFSTIGFSLFFSMGMFVTLMGICGPENDTGNVIVLGKRLYGWCKSKRNKTKTPEPEAPPIVS